MTVKAFRAHARLLKTLHGEICSEAVIGYPRSIMLYFGALRIPKTKDDNAHEKGLVTECPWRLETREQVIAGSKDRDKEPLKERIKVCEGIRVRTTHVFRPSFMVQVVFENDLRLWLFPDSFKHYDPNRGYAATSWYLTGYAYTSDGDGWEDIKLAKERP